MVEINGLGGKEPALNLRDTQIKTIDGKDIFLSPKAPSLEIHNTQIYKRWLPELLFFSWA
jgi:hypothetical protein